MPTSAGRPMETPEVFPVDLRDWVRFDPGQATRVRVLSSQRLGVDLWCLEPQQSTEVIVDDEREWAYTVIGGRSWFVTDQGEIGLDPMGAMMVPAGVAHGIQNRGVDPLIVLASASPAGFDTDPPVSDNREAIRDDDAPRIAEGLRRRLRG